MINSPKTHYRLNIKSFYWNWEFIKKIQTKCFFHHGWCPNYVDILVADHLKMVKILHFLVCVSFTMSKHGWSIRGFHYNLPPLVGDFPKSKGGKLDHFSKFTHKWNKLIFFTSKIYVCRWNTVSFNSFSEEIGYSGRKLVFYNYRPTNLLTST